MSDYANRIIRLQDGRVVHPTPINEPMLEAVA